jgi:hypothetical protein
MTPATRNWIATGRSLGGLPKLYRVRIAVGNRNRVEQSEPTSILIDLPWKRSANRASSGVSPAEVNKK